jgi:putative peptide zinc metalloprotease protein
MHALRLTLPETFAKLRADLEIRRENSDPHSSVLVKDPITRRFYRFTWIQAAVLAGLDGCQDAGAVADAAAAACEADVTRGQVEEFVLKLQGLLLLDTPLSWSRLEKLGGRKHRFLEAILSVKIHAWNPDRLLVRMEKSLGGFLFGRACRFLAWVSIAAGLILSIVNWDQLFLSIPDLFTIYSIPLILAVAFLVMTAHEFGHALTLKHFGGKVEEMGFLILYFIPGFYCNVNDAWMLPKRERMQVTIAGGYVQLVVWSWATIFWRLLSPETFASRLCLIAIAFSGIQTLLNFNPLIRLDGYYLLSDYLEVPNLRKKSFQFLRQKLRLWLTGIGKRVTLGVRERRIFVLYGLSSFAFSAVLLLIVLGRLGGWMVGRYQTWGAVLFSAVCLMVLPAANRENAAATGNLAKDVGKRIRKAPYLLIAMAVLAIAGFFPWELKVTAEFTILPGQTVAINPDVEGILRAIYVDEGSRVKKGDVLAEIQNLELSNAYEETKGQLAASMASLNLLKAGSRPEEIERARRAIDTKRTDLDNVGRVEQERKVLLDTVAKREAELKNAESNFERSKRLAEQGLIPRNELDRDQTTFAVAQKELAEAQGMLKVLEERTDRDRQLKSKSVAEAQSDLTILLAGARKESIQAAEADVAKLEQKQSILQQQIEHLQIRSTIDGIVSTPYLKNKIGAFAERGSLFCQIVDISQVVIDMPVPEKEIADVKIGYPIVVKVSAYPKQLYNARVKSISPIALAAAQERKVAIRGELANADGALKSGMTGAAKILCGKRMIGELVTRRFIRWLRTEFWEYLP